MDHFIPIVGRDALRIFAEAAHHFGYAVLPYYEVVINPEDIRLIREANPGIKLILSSIMPDEYLEREETLRDFLGFASEHGFDYIIAWDTPTYLDDEEASWRNTLKSLEVVERLRGRFNIIPLVKGAYPEHKRYACERLAELGFETVAIHASPYLSTNQYIEPYLRRAGLTGIRYTHEYLKHLLELILEYPFKEVLVLGGAGPRHVPDLIALDPDRIRLAGYSWYIDATRMTVYGGLGDAIDIRRGFYHCNCDVCLVTGPRLRREGRYISLHNLLISRELIRHYAGEESRDYRVERHDLILDTYEDLLILNDLMIGGRYSLWRLGLKMAGEHRPRYLVLTGRVFDTSRISIQVLEEFREWVETHRDTRIILVWDMPPGRANIGRLLDNLLYRGIDLVEERPYQGEAQVRELVTRLVLTARWGSMTIRKETWGGGFDVTIRLLGPSGKPGEAAIEDLGRGKGEDGWIVTDYIEEPYIDRERRIATPGRWGAYRGPARLLRPGGVYITHRGEVEILEGINPLVMIHSWSRRRFGGGG